MFSSKTATLFLKSSSNSIQKFEPLLFKKNISTWEKVQQGPPDPILGISVAFNKDVHEKKINLGVGAYRDDNGKPFILECVKKAQKKIFEADMNHEYAPIGGIADFTTSAAKLALGEDSTHIKEGKYVTSQTLSGTGALRLAAEFFNRFYPRSGDLKCYVPSPTWGNHIPLFNDASIGIETYRYYQKESCGLDFEGMVDDLKKIPNQSLILLHACAHNPTGVDPDIEQWQTISDVCKSKGHFVLFDCAYQGFASGDPEKDIAAVRLFVKNGHNIALCQSFAKNFGLYGERIGALTFLTESKEEASNIDSQLKILVRPMYSNPPLFGARIVSTILNDKNLTADWRVEVASMADRIIDMRHKLVNNLKKEGSPKDWSHITKQIGMFCFSGLTPEQVDKLCSDYHIYLTRNGRISMAGVTSKNVEYLASSIYNVTK